MLRPTRADWLLRWDHAIELGLGALSAYVAIYCLRFESTVEMRIVWLFLACGFLSAMIGVWFAKEWGRWLFGSLAALSALGFGFQTLNNLMASDGGNPLVTALPALLFGVVAHRMVRPVTGRQFRLAREALARARESSI